MSASSLELRALPIHVVMNAGSGADDKESAHVRLRSLLAAGGRQVEMHLLDHAEELRPTLEKLVAGCRTTPAMIVAAGGDGTINAAAAMLRGTGIPFGVVPMGTFNYFARSLGIAVDLEQAARVLLDGELRPVPVGCINDRVFLVNAILGLYVRLIEARERHKKFLGRSKPVALLSGMFTALRGQPPFAIRMTIDDEPRTLATPLVFISINPLQMRLLNLALAQCTASGLLGMMVVRKTRRLGLLSLGFRAAFGTLNDSSLVETHCAAEIEVSSRRPRVKLVIDGEVMELAVPLRFSVQRDALLMVCPRADQATDEAAGPAGAATPERLAPR